jgi:hypothetical protein
MMPARPSLWWVLTAPVAEFPRVTNRQIATNLLRLYADICDYVRVCMIFLILTFATMQLYGGFGGWWPTIARLP